MRVVVTDYYSAANRGDAAILEGVIESIKCVFPDAEFQVITENVDAAELINGVEAYEQCISPQQWKKWFRTGKLKPIDGALGEIYRNADLIVSTGGHLLTDAYFPAKIGMLLELYYCTRLESSVVLFAQTIGPIKKKPYRSLTRRVLNKLDLITVRDKRSLKTLEEMKLDSVPIHFTADAAFAMPQAPPRKIPLAERGNERVPKITRDESITVTISAREVTEFYNTRDELNYLECMKSLAEYLAIEQNVNVIFVSTCTSITGYAKDDRLISHRIIGDSDVDSITILQGEYTPYELREILSQSDLHFGTRMHSCILAAKAGTPIVGIEYQFKVSELFNQLEIDEYTIEIGEMTEDSLIDLAKYACRNRERIKTVIERKVGDIEEKAYQNGMLISELETLE